MRYDIIYLSIVLIISFLFIYVFFASKDIFVVCPNNTNYRLYIVDGDTFYLNNIKIRIIGIDTMELHNQKSWVMRKLNTRNESCLYQYAILAKSLLMNITNSQCIKVKLYNKDKYGRYLARVYNCTLDLSECTDLGRYMVLIGLAISFDDEYKQEENIAFSKRRGVWKCYGK